MPASAAEVHLQNADDKTRRGLSRSVSLHHFGLPVGWLELSQGLQANTALGDQERNLLLQTVSVNADLQSGCIGG